MNDNRKTMHSSISGEPQVHLPFDVEPVDDLHIPKLTRRNMIIVLIAGWGSFVFGYSNNIITGTLAQTSFVEKFLNNENANTIISGIIGGFLGGAFVGSIIQAPISNRYGRRVCNAIAAATLVMAGSLLAGSVHIAMFIVARIMTGLAAGILTSNNPVYISEIAPASSRGLLTSVHGVGITLAYIFSSVMALVFNFVIKSYQWRLPFVIYTVSSLVLLVSVYYIPESPRWLTEHERYEEALAVLETLHSSDGGDGARFARAEMLQIKAQVDADRSKPHDWMYIIRTAALRKRAICSIVIWIMNIGAGTLVVGTLTPELFGNLGFGTVTQLGMSIAWVTCATIGASINGFLIDRFGRVPLLVIGGFATCSMLVIEAVLQKYYLGTTYKPGLNAAAAFYFIYILVWGSFLDNTTYVYVPEIWPTHLRSHGSSIAYVTYYSVAIAITSPASLAFAQIGYKYYFVMVALCLSGTIYIWLQFPETSGLTLEEIAVKFGDEVEVRFEDAVAADKAKAGEAVQAEEKSD